MRSALCMITASLLFFVVPSIAGTSISLNASNDLVVEHAVIVQPTIGVQETTGFLTIWNGTREPVRLASVESDAFGKISIRRTEMTKVQDMPDPVYGKVPIPGRAELLMRPDGVYLTLGEPKRNVETLTDIDMVLVFDSGRRIAVSATWIRTDTQMADHHHGDGDE
ncbi:MAG: copper chaperone PCu(A)C [Hoeflea sp.]|uniref:copper chaperone PCu(A)C n=1 Tax=Hoeflea sp. TaxID=1940281 RepID=UPI001D7C342A|nr:copper chaperone PCu(A)C [Hoeflea sp.]MBU4530580.1 copper chaperone PCu(A)C [Alphaproteobacteria bacterium]MBU4542292.1 copper chaperone PCu(A)C [Alphaproteobacteria bacterium]MBU4551852.1 copper chaperone PCu(A)C [Alphaproteobacteria bacterium]MBV1726323.1 copper chaperone PCu(A)C [Hoeflea sp.]MBV1786193.1 copper chaperone PCu(A)C [Hoeflea sp.]